MGRNIANQFKDIVMGGVKTHAYNELSRLMRIGAIELLDLESEIEGFYSITGNLHKSLAVGIYYNGTLEDIVYMKGDKPTMLSLAEGQPYPYNKPYYGGKHHKGTYVGEIGEGGKDGVKEANDFLHGFDPENKNGFSLVVVAGMEYAEFVETKRNHDVLSNLADQASSIIGSLK